MLKPWLVSNKTGILSVGVRVYKLSSTHSGSNCSETFAAVMSQSWSLPQSEALPSQGRRAQPAPGVSSHIGGPAPPRAERSGLCPHLRLAYWLQPHSRDGAPSPGDTILGATVLENRAQIFTQSPSRQRDSGWPSAVTFCDLEGGVVLTSQLTQKM